MNIERVATNSLTFDPSNARKHDDANLDAIKGSLLKFGQQKPIVVDAKGIVLAGNGTLAAAKKLGWDSIDVVRTELSGVEAIAYALADNRSSELAEWDMDILKDQLKGLHDDNFEIADIGFDPDEFSIDEFSGGGNTDEDDIPDVADNPFGVARGQVWQLGQHRMMCGDSTDKVDVDQLMNGEKADMVFTDPPYGIGLNTDYISQYGGGSPTKGRKNHTGQNIKHKPIHSDNEEFNPIFLLEIFDYCEEIFLWGANYYWQHLSNSLSSSIQVWDKRVSDGLRKMHGNQLELCWSKAKHLQSVIPITWCGAYGSDEGKAGHKKIHPTQKPIKLAEWFLDQWCDPSGLVVDLFLGSGSTLIACEKTNRKCYGMEIDPHYCSVIIKRWQDYTQQEAKLIG